MGLDKVKVEGARIRVKTRWKEKGDDCIAEFFFWVREIPRSTIIKELRDEEGELQTQEPEIEHIAQTYYRKLYENPPKHEEELMNRF